MEEEEGETEMEEESGRESADSIASDDDNELTLGDVTGYTAVFARVGRRGREGWGVVRGRK